MVIKAQYLRVIDVLFLGPFMVWFGIVADGIALWAQIVMVFFGITTIFYNAKNWLVIEGFLSKKWGF